MRITRAWRVGSASLVFNSLFCVHRTLPIDRDYRLTSMVPTAHNTRSDGVGGAPTSAAATGAPPPPTHWAGGAPGGPGAGGSAVFARRPQAVAPQVRRSANINKGPLFFVCVADLYIGGC